ncbi:hypothetical protein OH76DRAFT_64576 [Lentinus brumalis]|uniref:Uncharacterized protein n=1 Tax=Lentinus brumalis TaxID=2498619 RepID=A0A371DKI3_9APHY|nr:hypothetical protein OH76DRAFT_64576 [Polyporus brumalis]
MPSTSHHGLLALKLSLCLISRIPMMFSLRRLGLNASHLPPSQFTLAHGLVVSPYLSPDLDLPHRASHHRCVQFIVSCTYDPEQPVALALSPLRPPPSSCAPRLRWPGLTLAGADACRTGCGGRPCIITLFTYRAFVPFICGPDSDTADPHTDTRYGPTSMK